MGSSLLVFTGSLFTILAIALTIVALATPMWERNDAYGRTTTLGLWTSCSSYDDGTYNRICTDFGIDKVDAAVRFCRFTCIISVIVATVAYIIFWINRKQHKWRLATFMSMFLIVACGVLMFCATTWYALKYRDSENRLTFGYSIIIAWVSIPCYIVGGALLVKAVRVSEGKDYNDRNEMV